MKRSEAEALRREYSEVHQRCWSRINETRNVYRRLTDDVFLVGHLPATPGKEPSVNVVVPSDMTFWEPIDQRSDADVLADLPADVQARAAALREHFDRWCRNEEDEMFPPEVA